MASIADSPLMDNEPLAVTPENTWAALLQADEIGRAASAAVGDRAYRRLRRELTVANQIDPFLPVGDARNPCASPPSRYNESIATRQMRGLV